ncbi:aldo/keto reductase [Pseudodesulfovibrio senegalensis]|uniref:Aldo/keto reductase n=1 Tax=Pseudodesulfovibrio senegalensis TaxID=1721087 RepID=A0A6N6N158_9BACT|nr:aldo/keto reductase [Pseudodesulfovibrio senegalensis]KAB1441634.1 aldo/keto reductase [Pseudodesulfovibrio senegalensis]
MSTDTKFTTLGNSDIRISGMGLGCMGLSEFYGEPVTQAAADDLVAHALDSGVNFFDTADMYGSGHNERLLAHALKGRRDQAVIATKFGIVREKGEYARTVCGAPEYVRQACHDSLRRLETDHIDLYYIHRIDVDTPIEDTVGEMSRLAEEGKIRAIGLSEASAQTLRRAHAVHPVSALQSEYSMFTRDPEQETLAVTRELGASFVAYSPICRGLLGLLQPGGDGKDFRQYLPRFQGQAYEANREVALRLDELAQSKGCTLAQLSLAWVMAQSGNVVPIPGTTKPRNLTANIGAFTVNLDAADLRAVDAILDAHAVQGARYTEEGMKGVNV